MKYQPEIDGLRAVAVLPVIFFHAGFGLFQGGYVGVDVFFVISGYLITSIIAEQMRQGRFSLAGFYERRARRILPALFLVCFACIPFARIWMSAGEFQDFSQSLAAVVAFSSNFLFWSQSGYFERAVELKPLLHTWSLAVEEQFYLVFPLLLLFLARYASAARIGVLALITAASFGFAVYSSAHFPAANFYLIPSRAWELGVGVLLALIGFEARSGSTWSRFGATFGMLMIAFAVVHFSDQTPFPSHYALLPVLGTALVIVFGAHDIIVGPILRSRACIFIGLISYSLYLWHQPILAFLRIRWGDEISFGEALAAIGLTFLLAVLSWRFVEQPFRDRRRISLRQVKFAASSTAALLVALGLAGHVTQGLFMAPDAVRISHLEDRLRVNRGLSNVCEAEFTLSPECRTSDAPEIALWGDSYAMHLAQGLVASAPDIRLIQFTMSVCGPVLGLAPVAVRYPEALSETCLDFNRQVWNWLEQSDTVRYVVLSSSFAQYAGDHDKLYTAEGVRENDPDFVAGRFIETLDRLVSMGMVPIVVSPPPRTGADIGRCLMRAHLDQFQLGQCNIGREEYLDRQRAVRELLQRIDARHHVVWLDQDLCDEELCLASVDDVFIYRDSGHLSHEGSDYLGRKMGWYALIRSMEADESRE